MKTNQKNNTFIRAALVVFQLLVLFGCADGGIIGTGKRLSGTAATGAPIANADVIVKSQSGERLQIQTDGSGEYALDEIELDGPFISRVSATDGTFLYSIAFLADQDEEVSNIHPLSDLIVRNWAARNGIDLDALIGNELPLDVIPDEDEINSVEREIINIIRFALLVFGSSETFDLLTTQFVADGSGFDGFLDNTRVVIDNDLIDISIINPDPNNPINNEVKIVENLPLDTDFLSNNDAPPTTPTGLRAVVSEVNSEDGEIIVVWNPSGDDRGVAGYNVYRNGEFITTTPYPVFIDSELPLNQNYIYQVEAIDNRDQVSDLSDTSEEFLSEPDTTPPVSATNLQVEQIEATFQLTWLQQDIDDVIGFRIIRDDNLEFAVVTDTRFDDSDLIDGTTYCYQIVSFDAAGNESDPSQQVCSVFGGASSPSLVNLSAQNFAVDEASGLATITATRFGNSTEEISVNYRVVPISATESVDYVAAEGVLTWLADETGSQSFDIQILMDFFVEGNETLDIELFDPSSNTTLGSISDAMLTIIDETLDCTTLEIVDITINTTLSDRCYLVESSITVTNNAELSILPGVALVFSAGTELRVEQDGRLLASGNDTNPVLFTGAQPQRGFWNGIDIHSQETSLLEEFVVEYGGAANIRLSESGQANINSGIIRFAEGFGFLKTEQQTLTGFNNLTITLNGDAPVSIDANSLEDLSTTNTYIGNMTLAGDVFDHIYVTALNGEITQDQTWQNLDVPYFFFDSEYFLDASLSIEAGTELEFGSSSRFDVRPAGQLRAIGTNAEPVIFTGKEKFRGSWGKLVFVSANDNLLEHVVIEYAGQNLGLNQGSFTNLAIAVDGTTLTLNNVTSRQSDSFGVTFSNAANLTINNLTVTENFRPALISLRNIDALDVSSSFIGNDTDIINLNDSSISSDLTLLNLGASYLFLAGDLIDVSGLLTIEAGLELLFRESGGFNINSAGGLSALGTSGMPIIFGAENPQTEFWSGILFSSSSSVDNVIDNAIIQNGGKNDGVVQGLVGFINDGNGPASGRVSNTQFRMSESNGIRLDADAVVDTATGNTFEDITGSNIFTP